MNLKSIEHIEVLKFTELGTGWEKRAFAVFAVDGRPLFCDSVDNCPPSTGMVKFTSGKQISWVTMTYTGTPIRIFRLRPESKLFFKKAKLTYGLADQLHPLAKQDRNAVLEMIAEAMKLSSRDIANVKALQDPELLNFLMQVDSAVLEKVLAVMNAGLPPTSTPTLKLVA